MLLSDIARTGRAALRPMRRLVLLAPLLLTHCASAPFRLFAPKGPVSDASLRFTLIDVGVMALIIVPTGLFILWCLWRYHRARRAVYAPEFDHSLKLEALIWGIPVLVVAGLAVASYRGTFAVDPYGPHVLAMPAKAGQANPLEIDVIATDWQWVFVYPRQHIATVDRLVVPAGRNVDFRLTSTGVVNDFFIPQLTDMIDVMPGMRTKDAMRASHPGSYEGFSANYSGAGFAWMRFRTDVVTNGGFEKFLAQARQSATRLTYVAFTELARPTINLHQRPRYFTDPSPRLFRRVIAAARNGKTYPVPPRLTEMMARDLRNHATYLDPGSASSGQSD